jgi:hypothetical protein
MQKMSRPWRHLPVPARAIAITVTDAVSAAGAHDQEAFADASVELAALDAQRVGLVVGAVVRSLLEDLHPDGLTGDDVHAVLERCARSALDWTEVDPGVLLVLLTGALGIHDPDEEHRPPGALEVARHAPLLVADLLDVAGRPLTGYLEASFAEIARGEFMDS